MKGGEILVKRCLPNVSGYATAAAVINGLTVVQVCGGAEWGQLAHEGHHGAPSSPLLLHLQ